MRETSAHSSKYTVIFLLLSRLVNVVLYDMRPTSFFKLQYFLILQNCEHYFMCLPYIPLQSYDNIRNNRRNESIYVFCNVGVVRITVTYRIQIRVSLNLLKNSVFSEISRENCCITDFVLKLFFLLSLPERTE